MERRLAELPLHGGKAPRWLFQRMKRLAREIISLFLIEGRADELIRNLADPYWFQSLGCVLGFDWHSSGLTTTTGAALKEGLRELSPESGLFIVGGKGKTALNTPEEIKRLADKSGFDADRWINISRLVARVDNNAVQDGYQLYFHLLVFTEDGRWGIVQQGMNTDNRYARRYHWLGEEVKSFVNEPHKAICTERFEDIVLNLTARESGDTRDIITRLSQQTPDKTVKEWENVILHLPQHHPVDIKEIQPKNLRSILLDTYSNPPEDFQELLLHKGVGAKTLRALSLISELVYKQPPSFSDPARFSFAHGGKDGYPYPVDKKLYDTSIDILERAVKKAKLGQREELNALKRLSLFY